MVKTRQVHIRVVFLAKNDKLKCDFLSRSIFKSLLQFQCVQQLVHVFIHVICSKVCEWGVLPMLVSPFMYRYIVSDIHVHLGFYPAHLYLLK